MVRRRKVKSDDQRNGLQRKKPGKERPDNCKYSQPDPESEKVGSRVPRRHELRVDSNLQQDLGDGGQNHADKEFADSARKLSVPVCFFVPFDIADSRSKSGWQLTHYLESRAFLQKSAVLSGKLINAFPEPDL
jgi:hypothetical protein